jgi:hypothetical protein
MSVQPSGDGAQELRFYLVKDDESYCFSGTVIDHHNPLATLKFNGVCFAVHNNPGTTALRLRDVKVDMGVPIEVPSCGTHVESAGGKAVPTAFALNPNAVWDGTDAAGSPASSGIYLCRLVVKSGDGIRVFSRKMLMLE